MNSLLGRPFLKRVVHAMVGVLFLLAIADFYVGDANAANLATVLIVLVIYIRLESTILKDE